MILKTVLFGVFSSLILLFSTINISWAQGASFIKQNNDTNEIKLNKTNIVIENVNSTTNQTNSGPYLVYSNLSGLIELSDIDRNKYVVIDKFGDIRISVKSNIYEINFKGRVRLYHQDKTLTCNNLTVIVMSNTVKEISGSGNVLLREGNNVYLGNKFFYIVPMGKIVMYEVRTFMDDQYFFADFAMQISDGKFFFKDVYFTKSDLVFPTYKVESSYVWYYRGDYLLSLNNRYTIGTSSFLYFPTYFQLFRYTDIFTDFGIERNIGFYVQNTVFPRGGVFSSIFKNTKLKFDHYERLGEYLGFEFPSIEIISNLSVRGILNLEYDKKFESKGNTIVNYIDQYGTGDYTEYRTFGWHYLLNLSYRVSGTSVEFSTEDLNDPLLPQKFSYRRERFDTEKFLFPEQNYFWVFPGEKPFITRNIKIGFSLPPSSFSFSFDWVYQLRKGFSTTNTNTFGVVVIEDRTNKYDNSYYRYDLQKIAGPNISYSFSPGNIISYSIEVSTTNVSKIQKEEKREVINISITNEIFTKTNKDMVPIYMIFTNIITNVDITTNDEGSISTNVTFQTFIVTNQMKDIQDFLLKFQSTNVNTNTNVSLSLGEFTEQTNIVKNRLLSFAVSPSGSFSMNANSIFRIEDGQPLEDSFSHRENIGLSSSLSFFDSIISFGNSLLVNNVNIWSRSPDPYRKRSDDLNSGTSLSMQNSSQISPKFFERTLFFFQPSISVSHSLRIRLTRPPFEKPEDDPYIDNITEAAGSLNFSLRFLDLSVLSNDVLRFLEFNSVNFSTGISYNFLYLRREIQYVNDKYYWTNKISNPIGFNISFGRWLNLRFSYRITVSNENITLLPSGTSINGSVGVRDIYPYTLINKISSIDLSYSVSFDYINPINNSFSLNLSTSGQITDKLTFSASTSIINTKIFRYVREYAEKYNVTQVNLIQDIIDAISIFDINALRRTLFKNSGVSFFLSYDLYDWIASLGGGIKLQKDTVRNIAFFEPYISFEVKSKKNIGIELPPIKPELYRLFQ